MFSFIIPVFNSEQFLIDCINSIIAVPFEMEIIIVDDGSTDSSNAICMKICENNPYIKYFRKENGGAASARNYGIDKSNGEYLVFVDSDDTLDSKWYEKIDEVINKNINLYVYGMAFDYYLNEELVKSEILSNKFSGMKTTNDIKEYYSDYFNNNTLSSACNKIFKASIIKYNNIRFNENMTIYEDLDFVIQYLCHTDGIFFIPDALYHYRLAYNNDHYKRRIKDLCLISKNLDNLSQTISKFTDNKSVHTIMSNLYMDILYDSLLMNKHSVSETLSVIVDYVKNSNINYKELSDSNKTVYEMIKHKEFSKLLQIVKYKKIKNNLKGIIKSLIKI